MAGEEEVQGEARLGGRGLLLYLGLGARMLQPGNMRQDLRSIHLLEAGVNAMGALITRL